MIPVRSVRPKARRYNVDYSKRGNISRIELDTIRYHEEYLLESNCDIDELIEFENMFSMVYVSPPKRSNYIYEDEELTEEWLSDFASWIEIERERIEYRISPYSNDLARTMVYNKLDNRKWMVEHSTNIDKCELFLINERSKFLASSDGIQEKNIEMIR